MVRRVPDAPRLHAVDHLARAKGDALVLLVPTPLLRALPRLGLPARLTRTLAQALAADRALGAGKEPLAAVLPAKEAPGGRVVLASLGALADETDDARRLAELTLAAVKRAIAAGAHRPIVQLWLPEAARFERGRQVVAQAALAAGWTFPAGPRSPLRAVSVVGLPAQEAALAQALEEGRRLCRDLVVGDPEVLTPVAAAAACEAALAPAGVQVSSSEELLGYPLLSAVSRAAQTVARHRAQVTTLECAPQGPVTHTLLLAGKGITYDTGGADLKTDGAMAGMSRDKGGAATVAGLVLALARLRLPGLRVVAKLGWVRNSVGEESFVSDEIVVARSGKRVRIGNTDAEGRLVLADLLCALAEEAKSAPRPLLLSMATLTGHAYRAYGPCVAALQNGPARKERFLERLAAHGELWGEPLEHSRPRREDYQFIAPKSGAEDLVSSNRLASVDTPRGHQGPYAFIESAAGLRGGPWPFAHLDLSGALMHPPQWLEGTPTASPIASLVSLLREGPNGAEGR
jgi:leucyl aminopeptidase